MSTRDDMLLFSVGAQRLALPVEHVHEIVRAVALTSLPGAPDVVAGTVDVRGRALPVFDVRRRFGEEPRDVDPDDHFIVARGRGRDVALWVDRVERLEERGRRAPAESGVRESSRHVAGLLQVREGLALIQDLEAFLSSDEESELVRALDDPNGPELGA